MEEVDKAVEVVLELLDLGTLTEVVVMVVTTTYVDNDEDVAALVELIVDDVLGIITVEGNTSGCALG